jgi:hypothetical protein
MGPLAADVNFFCDTHDGYTTGRRSLGNTNIMFLTETLSKVVHIMFDGYTTGRRSPLDHA